MRNTVLGTLVVVMAITSTTFAGERKKTGFSLGASLGSATIKINEGDWEIDEGEFSEDDLGYKVFAGYRFMKFVGVEGSYFDLGNPSTSGIFGGRAIDTEVALSGWNMSAVGYIPIGIFDIFGKVGFFWWDGEIEARMDTEYERSSDSGSDLTYGIGAAVWIKQINIRLEFEMFDVERANDVYMVSLGLAYTF